MATLRFHWLSVNQQNVRHIEHNILLAMKRKSMSGPLCSTRRAKTTTIGMFEGSLKLITLEN